MVNAKTHPWIWIDLEMTGLDPAIHRIIEIATLVTDSELNVIAEGPVIAVHQSAEVMGLMDQWCVNTHGQSGLTQRVIDSQVSEARAQQLTLEFLQQYVAKGASPMCGNSVHQDRRFLNRYMPELEQFFHYRNLDVSTLKELAQRWAPQVASQFKKESKHMALDDIRDSVSELRFYRENFIKM